MAGTMFHANPWVHARLDERGALVEKPSLCPTEASLYRLCELDFLVESFRHDEIAHLLFAQRTGTILTEAFGKPCRQVLPRGPGTDKPRNGQGGRDGTFARLRGQGWDGNHGPPARFLQGKGEKAPGAVELSWGRFGMHATDSPW